MSIIISESMLRTYIEDDETQRIAAIFLEDIADKTKDDAQAYALILLIRAGFQVIMDKHGVEIL